MLTKTVIASLAFVVATATLAFAAPLSYSVLGVDANDTLALRAGPSASAQKLADIPADAEGLRTTGRTTASGDWIELRYEGQRGWVSARYLAFGPAGGIQLPALLRCSGTEPFWSVDVSPQRTKAELNFLDRKYMLPITRAASAMNRNEIWIVKAASGKTQLSLIVRQESCSDGMSDRDYPYSAIALVPGSDIIAGCCERPRAQ